jgi:hypothetical protein
MSEQTAAVFEHSETMRHALEQLQKHNEDAIQECQNDIDTLLVFVSVIS